MSNPMPMNDQERFALRENLVVEQVEDEVIVLDLDSNAYFGLNPVGRAIWQAVAEGKSFAEIVNEVCARFDVTRDVAASDAHDFLEALLERRLARRLDT